jgi:hypothetical protein
MNDKQFRELITAIKLGFALVISFMLVIMHVMLVGREYLWMAGVYVIFSEGMVYLYNWIFKDRGEGEKIMSKLEYDLYKALDDIDTTSDIYKGNYKARCEHIDEIVNSIKNFIEVPHVQDLYNKYYKKEEDILTPIFKENE